MDDSKITVESIILGGVQREAATSVTFAVSFEPEDGIYTATGDFHILVTGDTRDELEKAITGALEFLWREYVTADPSGFSADALALRDRLIQTFAEVKNTA